MDKYHTVKYRKLKYLFSYYIKHNRGIQQLSESVQISTGTEKLERYLYCGLLMKIHFNAVDRCYRYKNGNITVEIVEESIFSFLISKRSTGGKNI